MAPGKLLRHIAANAVSTGGAAQAFGESRLTVGTAVQKLVVDQRVPIPRKRVGKADGGLVAS